ncbi:hypothetical protein ACEWY4_018590 [Coilia grayii]|uniref:Polyhomeotic-like protein 3 n=1 Tax=Coilia grayii TaxID=363190 RepID=A0ABD1JF91_9TELE
MCHLLEQWYCGLQNNPLFLCIFGLQLPVTKPRREMDREPKRQSESEKRESPAESAGVNPHGQPKASNLPSQPKASNLPNQAKASNLPNQANGSSVSIQANKTNKSPTQTNGNNLLKQPSGKILPAHTNGNQSSTSVHTTITTFHTTPTPTDRKVVQVKLFGDKMPSSSSSLTATEPAPVSSPQSTKPVTTATPSAPTHMVRASPSAVPVTAGQRISPHALLLGKGPCTTQAQMLLRAQMLQSLTLRPPPPGTLTIPPNLPLKASAMAPTAPVPRPRTPIVPLRLSHAPPAIQGREAPKVGDSSPTSPHTGAKTPPVRHLTVPSPSLYSPVQSHALAKHKASSPSSLKRSHSQMSSPQQPALIQNHTTPPTSPQGPTPKKPLPELQRCPSTQSLLTQAPSSFLASSPSATTIPTTERTQGTTTTTPSATSPTLALPLGSINPTSERSLLASKQLLKIALSSASVQLASSQSKMAAIPPPRDFIQSKPLSPMFSRPVRLDGGGQVHSPQRSLSHPPLSQLSPLSSAQIPSVSTTTPKIPSPLPSPQRPCPPSPILPPGLPISTQKPPETPVAVLRNPTPPTTPTDIRVPKDPKKGPEVEGKGTDSVEKRLKPLGQSPNATIVDKPPAPTADSQAPSSAPAEKALDFTLSEAPCSGEPQSKGPIKNTQKVLQPPTAAPAAVVNPADHSEDLSTQSDNHSAVSSLSSDLSPTQSSVLPASDDPPVPSGSPSPLTPLLGRNPPCPYPSSGSTTTPEHQEKPEAIKPIILTHLVDGFIIQEGLEPFPVTRSSLIVEKLDRGPEGAVNGLNDPEAFHRMDSMEHVENSSDSDADAGPHDNGFEEGHRVMLQCEFCKRKGPSHSFVRSKRFCSSSCARRFSQNKRFRPVRRSGSQDGQHSPGFKPAETAYESGSNEQWRVQPPKGDEEAAAPMKTRLRRHTELERERETKSRDVSEEARNDPSASPQDPAASPDQSSRPRPAEWTVDQVWEFISSLPGCQEIAESFRAQEIDGQALLLLTEDHLMSAMNVKLGPALKICARINSLKEY